MTKTELKQNITKINKLLRSDSYETGIELLKTFDDPEITKGTAKTIMAKIKKLLTQYDYDSIDQGTGIVQLLSDRINFEELLNGCSVTVTGYLEPNKIFSGTKPAQPYLNYALVNTIALQMQAFRNPLAMNGYLLPLISRLCPNIAHTLPSPSSSSF